MGSRSDARAGITALAALAVACTQEMHHASSGDHSGGAPASTGGTGGSVAASPSGSGGAGGGGAGNAAAAAGSAGLAAGANAGGAGGAAGAATSGGAGGAAGAAADREHVCGTAMEDAVVTLSCPSGQIVDQVLFASYGTPSGACGSFAAGDCDAPTSRSVVEQLCVGRATCTVAAANGSFGDPCNRTVKSLSIEASCVPGDPTVQPRPFKGVANSPCAARTLLEVSWYYNWEQTEHEPCSDGRGGEFVPMIWGHPGAEQTAGSIASAVASFVERGYTHVLGFNEPDNPSQSNIPVGTAIALWPSFDKPAIQVVSPGTAANQNPGQAWFTDFMAQLNADPELRADVLAIHWYGWNAGSCDASASQLEGYIEWAERFAGNRPIWITEWGCLNQSAPELDTVVAFYRGALEVFARHPRIERYAWYPWSTNCGLVDQDGALTALGEAYAEAPAYR